MRIFQLALAALLSFVTYGAAEPEPATTSAMMMASPMPAAMMPAMPANMPMDITIQIIDIMISSSTMDTKTLTTMMANKTNPMEMQLCEKIQILLIVVELSKNTTLVTEILTVIAKTMTSTQMTQLTQMGVSATNELQKWAGDMTLINNCMAKFQIDITIIEIIIRVTTTRRTTSTTRRTTSTVKTTSTVRLNTTSTVRTTAMTSTVRLNTTAVTTSRATTTALTTTRINATTTNATTVRTNVTTSAPAMVTKSGGIQNLANLAFTGLLGLLAAALML